MGRHFMTTGLFLPAAGTTREFTAVNRISFATQSDSARHLDSTQAQIKFVRRYGI